MPHQPPTTAPLQLTASECNEIAVKRATCPFLGSAVASSQLPVRNSAAQPLASIDDVVKLGNTGKNSNLGHLLSIFCEGNHAFMAGQSGALDRPVPPGTFSLDLPGSQGSHAGHSGILQGNPKVVGSGRFSEADFNRLTSYATGEHLKRSDIGKFIAENVMNDRAAHAPGLKTAGLAIKDLLSLAGQVVETLTDKVAGTDDPVESRQLFTRLTKLLGEDHLIASAGEFGLLAAFLVNSPRTQRVDAAIGTEPAFAVADIRAMFQDRRFPDGWEHWTKKANDWVVNTGAIAFAAQREFLLRKAKNLL
jgi:hypothetical protein